MIALPAFAFRNCCCYCWITCLIILITPTNLIFINSQESTSLNQQQLTSINNNNNINNYNNNNNNNPIISQQSHSTSLQNDEDVDMSYENQDYLEANITEKGRYLGSPCDTTCNPDLQNVICDKSTGFCECDSLYPVELGPSKGCAKPKKIGDLCFYRATCTFSDQHSTCTQVHHNALCDCIEGYHKVVIKKKVVCVEDVVLIATDFTTLLGVASGIAVISGLICFVLKLYSRARYSRPRHYANANIAPPMLFSSDTGIPLTLGRPSSRESQRSAGSLSCDTFARRTSSGPLVSSSRKGADYRAAAILLLSCQLQSSGKDGKKHRRTLSDVAEGSSSGLGSRRPSLASIHSSGSSARSFSARRFERERNDKEQRQALQEFRLAKMKTEQEQQNQVQQNVPTPHSPRTPHSTDELLPAVEEGTELFYNEHVTTSDESSASKLPLKTTLTSFASTSKPAGQLQFETTFTDAGNSKIDIFKS